MAESNTIKINKGDTLGAISKTHGVSISEIMAANPDIKNPNLIYAGNNLVIPTKNTPPVRNNVAPPSGGDMGGEKIITKNNVNDANTANQYINQFNDDRVNAPQTRQERIQSISKSIEQNLETEGIERPERFSYLEEYYKQRKEMGLNELESTLDSLNRDKRDLEASTRIRSLDEEGKPVATNVIAGRQSEIQRQDQEKMDFVQRQIAYTTDQYNSKVSVINTVMNFAGKDYENAVDEYQNAFSEKKTIYQMASDEVDAEFDMEKERRTNARANGEIIVNTAIKSGKTYEDMSTDTQLDLQKWGLQSGLGKDFFKDMFGISQDKEILTTIISKDKASASIVYKDGTTKKIKTGIYDAPASVGTANKNATLAAKVRQIFNDPNLSEQDKILEATIAGASQTLINAMLRNDPSALEEEEQVQKVEEAQLYTDTAKVLLEKNLQDVDWKLFKSGADEVDKAYEASRQEIISSISDRGGRIELADEVVIFKPEEMQGLLDELQYQAKIRSQDEWNWMNINANPDLK